MTLNKTAYQQNAPGAPERLPVWKRSRHAGGLVCHGLVCRGPGGSRSFTRISQRIYGLNLSMIRWVSAAIISGVTLGSVGSQVCSKGISYMIVGRSKGPGLELL